MPFYFVFIFTEKWIKPSWWMFPPYNYKCLLPLFISRTLGRTQGLMYAREALCPLPLEIPLIPSLASFSQ